MSRPSFHRNADNDADITLPCAQALLAATLALMSAYAAAVVGADAGARVPMRHLMALKIVSNLHSLRAHPSLAEPMRRVTAKLHRHWSAIAGADAATLALH